MPRAKPLTARAHSIVQQYLDAGDLAIDATVGNGRDTCFLAERVGCTGHVFGFDIQAEALRNTEQKLKSARLSSRVTLVCDSHANMTAHIPRHFIGKIKAVMFNLGYLPGSDKETITRTESTIKAIKLSTELLAPGGIISILAYRGHEGGQQEADAVRALLENFSEQGFKLEIEESPGPVLYKLKKKKRGRRD